jgi:hypothetical protein
MKRLAFAALALCFAPSLAHAAAPKSPAAKIAAAFRAANPGLNMYAADVTVVPSSHLIGGRPDRMKPGAFTNNKSGMFSATAIGDAPKGLHGTISNVNGQYRLVGKKAKLSNLSIEAADKQMAKMPR